MKVCFAHFECQQPSNSSDLLTVTDQGNFFFLLLATALWVMITVLCTTALLTKSTFVDFSSYYFRARMYFICPSRKCFLNVFACFIWDCFIGIMTTLMLWFVKAILF